MAGNGPLPDPNRVRRNAPTIPTTKLLASGRSDPAPDPPEWVNLGEAGSAWWEWAWSTPQACAWSEGDRVVVARRAALEDDLATIGRVESMDGMDVVCAENHSEVRALIGRLAGLVTGRLSILKEMRELDDRLGLTPKAMAALRWTIVPDPEPVDAPGDEPKTSDSTVTRLDERRRRLTDAS